MILIGAASIRLTSANNQASLQILSRFFVVLFKVLTLYGF